MDTFIANFINALPNALATAVVTIFLSGILLFIFQERIKNALAKSLFEYQTKFARNYEKRVETLETAYQKYVLFTDALTQVIRETAVFIRAKKELDATDYFKKEDQIKLKLNDFWHYFQANRLFFPYGFHGEIRQIYYRADIVQTLVTSIFFSSMTTPFVPVELPDFLTHFRDLRADSLDLNAPENLLAIMSVELEMQRLTLEHIYKLVSDT